MNLSIALLFALSLALHSTSCSRQPPPLRFSATWPSPTNTPAYSTSQTNWTRSGILRAPLADQSSQLMELHATFLSAEWRASYVAQQSKLQRLSSDVTTGLVEKHKKEATSHHQVRMIVSTYHGGYNDLHRRTSVWRVTLVDEDGNELVAEKIVRDRRPRPILAAEFGPLQDFTKVYLATFPSNNRLLSGKQFSLRVASSLGTVEVAWKSQ